MNKVEIESGDLVLNLGYSVGYKVGEFSHQPCNVDGFVLILQVRKLRVRIK